MTDVVVADQLGTERAGAILRDGGLVAFGTETVYGLGADATNGDAVSKIFIAKGRPLSNPLIVHYAHAHLAEDDVVMNSLAWTLAEAFWPGPLTLVLPKRKQSRVVPAAGARLPSLAIRVPRLGGPSVLDAAARPIVAPSANKSGRISPTSADDVRSELGGSIDLILDSGICPVGVESTVLSLVHERPRILRYGGLELERLRQVLPSVDIDTGDAAIPLSPGQLHSHYAPECEVRLNQPIHVDGFAYLGFGEFDSQAKASANLSSTGNFKEAASLLFSSLRALDAVVAERKLRGILVAPIPQVGLGLAINDRLQRAAADRPKLDR